MTSSLISPQQLNAQIGDSSLTLLDVSVPKVTGENSGTQKQTIPGANVVNLKRDFSDPNGQFPNTVPTPLQFEETCNQLGITNDSKVVVFDNLGIYSSPRVWWLFKLMGHENVFVLDGGLPEWIKAGYPTIESIPWDRSSMKSRKQGFKAKCNSSWVINYQSVLKNVTENTFTIIDARSSGRFNGTSPEPRAQLKSGAIPNAVNLPYQDVLNGNKFKSLNELKSIFSNLHPENEIIYSCGSGLTACIILLAGQIAGVSSMKIYDGSWTEWAELQGLKKE